MTRINCIPVQELHSKHLLAEYRELPRVFGLASAYSAKHHTDPVAPPVYSLGKGHVKFFYTRLGFCEARFLQLVQEMKLRGFRPRFDRTPGLSVPREWRSGWTPTDAAMSINRERIQQRMPK